MAKAQLKEKQKQLREFIDKTNADEGAEVLRRDYEREKVYDDNVNNKSVDNGEKSGIINAKISDRTVELYSDNNDVFDMDKVDRILNSTFVGRDTVEYYDQNGMNTVIYYNYDSDGVAGEIRGREISIYALYNVDEEEVASTIIHEVSHERFNWVGTQEAEVNCFLMEAMHQNMGMITNKDIKNIVNYVRQKYSYLPEGDLYGF